VTSDDHPDCTVDDCDELASYLLAPEGNLCRDHAFEKHPRAVAMLEQTLGVPDVGGDTGA
jgi:hypothetical protein